jgi:hypothetical protein
MPIVGERFGQAKTTHHDKGNLIDYAGCVGLTLVEGAPRFLKFITCRGMQQFPRDQLLS